jgi:outer membrane lipoprotein-sorting protein
MNRRRKRERALIPLCCSLLVFASCSSQSNSPATPSASTETVVSSTPPFQTKEPERYRATRIMTSVAADGKTTVTTTSTARDGELRRTESKVETRTLIFLNLPEGTFVLLPDEKLYASVSGDSVPGAAEDGEISPEKLLHGDDLKSSYQKLGTELVGGRNTNKYRVVVNSSSATSVTPSETLIWIDEALGMPIRSETKSSDGTHVTMELSEIELNIDPHLFEIPNDFQKVSVGVALRGHPTVMAR